MATGVRTDTKEQAKVRAYTKVVLPAVKAYVEGNEFNLWNMCDKAHELSMMHKYRREDIGNMFRDAFAEAYKIAKGDRSNKNHQYNSYSTIISRLTLIGIFPEKLYDKERKSGDSFTTVWAKYTGKPNKKLDTKEDMSKTNLQKQASEGVVNAKELAEATVNSSLKKPNKILDAKPTGWIAPEQSSGFDSNKAWIKESKAILKSDASMFIRMVESCVNAHLLTEAVLALVRKELSKRITIE